MTRKLNIVYIGPLAFPLGFASTKRRRYMVDYMNNHGISAHVLSTNYKKDKTFTNPQKGLYGDTDFYDLSDYIVRGKILRFYREGKKKLCEWFVKEKKNVLIFHTILSFEELPFFIYAKRLGYKIVFDQVETSYKAKGTNTSLKRKLRIFLNELAGQYAYRRCAGSFVISEALKVQNERLYPGMPLCILPNSTPVLAGKEKQSFAPVPTILYSGTYAPKDGVSFLIEAFLKVQKKGIDCRLIMTGKGNPKDMDILNRVKDNPKVEYKGMVSDEELVSIMQDCDILTMTRTNSKFANFGFPFKLSEYLSTGNPVIASKVSDVERVLTHKENAYLVCPENADDIADGILFYIKNQNEALRIGRNGLQKMQETFSIDTVGNKFVGFLECL